LSKGQSAPNDPAAALLLNRFIVGGLRAAMPPPKPTLKPTAPISKRPVQSKERDKP